jgi:tRNA A37 threonylcarbamoyladenosine modification protein TsaB
MDAHRREVFAALYEVTEAAPLTVERLRIVQEPSAGDPREVLSRWSAPPDVVVGDGASLYADLLRGTTRAVSVLAAPPLAVTIAHLAVSLFLRGESVDPGGVQPLYVRRPDVEVERDRKGQQ